MTRETFGARVKLTNDQLNLYDQVLGVFFCKFVLNFIHIPIVLFVR